MQPKAVILTPTTTQIEELRSNFFKKLSQNGASSEGIVLYVFCLKQ